MTDAGADTEEIVLLDENWWPIGRAPKLASHNADTPLHLAFSCHLFNESGQVLVTRRARSKKTWPGVWTTTCCGHPAPGEAIEAAVRRRLRYELGLQVSDLQLVLPRYRYRARFEGVVENECCPVFVGRIVGEVTPNPNEVMDYQWLIPGDLTMDIAKHPRKYSYWCKQQIRLLEAANYL